MQSASTLALLAAGQGPVHGAHHTWPGEPPFYPRYPGRSVKVLNGSWEFAFLGDVPLVPIVPHPAEWESITVPDAFDLRPDRPRCGKCWAGVDGGVDDIGRCRHCCSRAFGHRGDERCWEALNSTVDSGTDARSFEACCGQDALRLSRGVGAYRVEVESQPCNAALILFAGCVSRCLVAVDGSFLADHAGLSPFSVEVPAEEVDRRTRSILVLADNRFDLRTHPVHQPQYDWYQAGGLIRTVQFHELATAALAYLAGADVLTRSLHEIDFVVRPSSAARGMSGISCHFCFDDDDDQGAYDVSSGSGMESRCRSWATWDEIETWIGRHHIKVPRARTWSLGNPRLHRLKVALVSSKSLLLDCIEVRFGLRTVETSGRDIVVNGEPVKLFGFNRHDMTDTPILTYDDLLRDVALLQALGANFVRGAHYAQDQRFLELCDVHGVVVWEEILGWQNTVADFGDGLFMTQSLRMADELVDASINHPSVLFFGFFNEGQSSDASQETVAAYKAMASRLRQRSGHTRLVSWGSSAGVEDQQLASADVCAFHAYPAWYPTTRPADLKEVQEIPFIWQTYAQWVEDNFPDKPLVITEAGTLSGRPPPTRSHSGCGTAPRRPAEHCTHRRSPPGMGRVRTKTVKKAAREVVERYYTKLTLDFQINKKISEEVASIPSKRLRNKIAGFITHLMKRIQRGPVRGISLKLQEEERERRMEYVPDRSEVDVEVIQVDPDTRDMLKELDMDKLPSIITTSAALGGGLGRRR